MHRHRAAITSDRVYPLVPHVREEKADGKVYAYAEVFGVKLYASPVLRGVCPRKVRRRS